MSDQWRGEHGTRGAQLPLRPQPTVSTGSERPDRPLPASRWVVAALVYGLMIVEGICQGGFWPADALLGGLGALVLLGAALVTNPPGRRDTVVVVSLLLLAAWWAVRAATTGLASHVLPLGASIVAFAAAFAAARTLQGRTRQAAGLAVACLGAAGALVGFAGLVWRWFPEAMPAQGLWRLASTLTYADAAGLVLGVCLLLALGSDLVPWLTRVTVCLCAGGLLATQSRGAYVALFAACAIVPWHRYRRFAVPLLAGAALGAAAIVTSPHVGRVPWLGTVLVLAVAVAGLSKWEPRGVGSGLGGRVALGAAAAVGLAGVVVLLRHELALRAFAPSDQDRSVEWSTALHQWWSAPLLGVGPDRLLVFHATDGTYARFVHNEYLQVAADGGVIACVLLLFTILSIARVVRRVDVLSSCATSALVCWAVGAAFDFDWHLTFVGFLGGWCLALAHGKKGTGEASPRGRHRRRAVGGVVRSPEPPR